MCRTSLTLPGRPTLKREHPRHPVRPRPRPGRVGLVDMTKDEATHRLLKAISELQDYSASQGPLERTSADEAISMLEEVIEALQKRQMEYPSFAG